TRFMFANSSTTDSFSLALHVALPLAHLHQVSGNLVAIQTTGNSRDIQEIFQCLEFMQIKTIVQPNIVRTTCLTNPNTFYQFPWMVLKKAISPWSLGFQEPQTSICLLLP